jgi:predicted  nucleic acid-binding Zn-ribbon protein
MSKSLLENAVTIRMTLEREQMSIVQIVADALDPEMIKGMVQKAINKFDFETEVQAIVDSHIRQAVQKAAWASMEAEMRHIQQKANKAMESAAEEVRKRMAAELEG